MVFAPSLMLTFGSMASGREDGSELSAEMACDCPAVSPILLESPVAFGDLGPGLLMASRQE